MSSLVQFLTGSLEVDKYIWPQADVANIHFFLFFFFNFYSWGGGGGGYEEVEGQLIGLSILCKLWFLQLVHARSILG